MLRGRGQGLRGRGIGRARGASGGDRVRPQRSRKGQDDDNIASRITEKTERVDFRRTAQVEEDTINDIVKAYNDVKRLGTFFGKRCEITQIVPTLYTRRDIEVLDLTEINSHLDPDPNDPSTLKGTVYDNGMGPSSYSKNCGIHPGSDCGGHPGVIDLGNNPNKDDYIEPYIDPVAGKILQAILNLVCPDCGLPIFTEKDLEDYGLSKSSLIRRVKFLEKEQKTKYKKGLVRCISEEVKVYDIRYPAGGRGVPEVADRCSRSLSPYTYAADSNKINNEGEVSNTEIRRILSLITPEYARLLGFRTAKPLDLLRSFVLVIPPSMREASIKGFEDKQTDYLGQEYKAIVKLRNEIRSTIKEKERIKKVNDLHARVLHIYTSSRGKSSKKPGAQEFEGIKEALAGKEGLIRKLMMGKRLNFTFRAVITPDVSLLFAYIGIPEYICNNNFKPVWITKHTIKAIEKMIKEGKVRYYVPVDKYHRRQFYSIENVMKKKDFRLRLGDAVARKLDDGDDTISGRNPTIHSLGIMSFKVKKVEGDTIRLLPPYCSPLNADFDGDEMHGYIPQSLLAIADARFVSNVVRSILNSENASNSMGWIMDAITAIYLMTFADGGYSEIDKAGYESLKSLLVWRADLKDLNKRLKRYHISKYSTRGLLSMLFPADFNYTGKNESDNSIIKIRDGVLISGTLGKKNVGVTPGSFIHLIYIYYGDYRAAYFINDGFKLANRWITRYRAFSLGIGDAQLNNENVKTIANATLANLGQIIEKIDVPTRNKVEEQRIEGEVIGLLQQRGESMASKLTKDVLSGENAFRATISSGAKGAYFNAAQMVAFVGQQFFLDQRLPKNITNYSRVTIYNHPEDRNPEAVGLIPRSLGDGLDPVDQFYHHKATRATLIDTTTKTAEAGEDHHLKDKALEDFCVHYDGTLRDGNGMIVQFMAGYNGLDPKHTVQISHKSKKFAFFVDMDTLIDQVNSKVRNRHQLS